MVSTITTSTGCLRTSHDHDHVYTPQSYIESVFYHIYPIGATGVAYENQNSRYSLSSSIVAPNGNVLIENVYEAEQLHNNLPPLQNLGTSPLLQVCTPDFLHHLKNLGVSAVYIGPLFQSKRHGYDTTDFFALDTRLGHSNSILRQMIETFQQNGIRVAIDAVYNHVGRDFWAFRDVCEKLEQSQYVDWFFTSLNNSSSNKHQHFGDPFSYDGWSGCYDLVKLNVQNPNVVRHLLAATRFWIDDLRIDGLRLDAADCLPNDFWKLLRAFVSGNWDGATVLKYDGKSSDEFFMGDVPTAPAKARSDFLLLGEITHGTYRKWVCPKSIFHSVTNYELWQGIWSSMTDINMFELGHTLERQHRIEPKASEFDKLVGPTKAVDGDTVHHKAGFATTPDRLWLYTFLDNHDVDRIASKLSTPSLEIAIVLSYMLPGVPSIYYGSEFAMQGVKGKGPTADYPLRPALDAAKVAAAVKSQNCPDGWRSEEWGIYSLYKTLAQLYHHSVVKSLLTRGSYYLFHLTSTSIGFVRFLQEKERVCVVVCASLEPVCARISMKLLKQLLDSETDEQLEFIDFFDPRNIPRIKKNDENGIELSIDYLNCFIVGHGLEELRGTLPCSVWSIRKFKEKASMTPKVKRDEIRKREGKRRSRDGVTESHDIDGIRQQSSEGAVVPPSFVSRSDSNRILSDLKLNWKSTFNDFNLADIGHNIKRLFDSEFGLLKNEGGELINEIDLEAPEFDVITNNPSSNHFQWALLSIALCLPPRPVFKSSAIDIQSDQEISSVVKWLAQWEEVLRIAEFEVDQLQKDLLTIIRRHQKIDLYLCAYHPMFSYHQPDVSIPFIPTSILQIHSGQVEILDISNNPPLSIHCRDEPLVVIAVATSNH